MSASPSCLTTFFSQLLLNFYDEEKFYVRLNFFNYLWWMRKSKTIRDEKFCNVVRWITWRNYLKSDHGTSAVTKILIIIWLQFLNIRFLRTMVAFTNQHKLHKLLALKQNTSCTSWSLWYIYWTKEQKRLPTTSNASPCDRRI